MNFNQNNSHIDKDIYFEMDFSPGEEDDQIHYNSNEKYLMDDRDMTR